MFGTCDCCEFGDSAARVRMYAWLWGFPGFTAITRTYTVGSGWDATAITQGMLARRVQNGVVTGVYEAKNNFTATADPASDTVNWRRCGLAAVGGTTDFWWNVEPMTKWMACAMYEVGVGWKLAQPYTFPRQDLGTICRWDSGLRRMKKSGGFSVPVTNDEYWRDSDGGTPEVDWKFGRYCRLFFNAGDVVIRKSGSTSTFWRCVTAVDYWDAADGTGDPASDARWVQWSGERSLWLDFTRAVQVAGAPWNHFTPARRYGTWRETTELWLGDVSLGRRVREFQRSLVTGRISVVRDDWVSEWTVALPDPPAGEDVSGVFYPETWPGNWTWVGVDFHYHRRKIDQVKITRGVYPDMAAQVSYTRKDYHGTGEMLRNPSGRSTTSPPWQPEPWPGPPHYEVATSNVSGSMALVRVESDEDSVEFEWSLVVPWWHEFDVGCFFATYDREDQYAVLKDIAFMKFGKKRAAASGSVGPTALEWYEAGAYMTNGVNQVHDVELRLVQRIEVDGRVYLSDLFSGVIALAPAIPSWGTFIDGEVDRGGEFVGSSGGITFAQASGDWTVLWRSSDAAQLPGFSWEDGRLVESRAELNRLGVVCHQVPHWMGEQLLGDDGVVSQVNEVMTYGWTADGTVYRVRVDDVEFGL